MKVKLNRKKRSTNGTSHSSVLHICRQTDTKQLKYDANIHESFNR